MYINQTKLVVWRGRGENLPPIQTPFGNVAQPQPRPHGRSQANVPREPDAFAFLFNMATAVSLRIGSAPSADSLSLVCLRADTSVVVAAANIKQMGTLLEMRA